MGILKRRVLLSFTQHAKMIKSLVYFINWQSCETPECVFASMNLIIIVVILQIEQRSECDNNLNRIMGLWLTY